MLARVLALLSGYDRLKERADSSFLAGDFGRALVQYRRARTLVRPPDARAVALDAIIRECESRDDSTSTRTTIRVAADPNDLETESRLEIEADLPFLANLADLFELAIADKTPSRAEAYRILSDDFKQGYVALVQGDAEEAVRALERAAQRSSPSFVVQLELGRALSLAERMEEACDALIFAQRLLPGDCEVALLLAAVQIELGRHQEASDGLERLLKLDERTPEVLFLHGKALAGLSKRDDALERFRETVQRDSRFHEAYFEAAKLVEQASDPDGALALLTRACSLAPDEIPYNRALVRLVLQHELEAEVGLGACDRLMVTDVDRHWEYLFWIGELYLRRGWKREARDPLQKALELVPHELSNERLSIEQKLAQIH